NIDLDKIDGFVSGGNADYTISVCSTNGCTMTTTNSMTINLNTELTISNIETNNVTSEAFTVEWQTNGSYDCTMIYSTKDGNLDDDFLVSTRDADDYIWGSNFPKSNNNGICNYAIEIKNQGDNSKYFNGAKGYYNLICYDQNRNKVTSSVYSFDIPVGSEADNYPGFNLTTDKVSYSIDETVQLELEKVNTSINAYYVDVFASKQLTRGVSEVFLIESDVLVSGGSKTVNIDLDKIDGFVSGGNADYTISVCSTNGCTMTTTNSMTINLNTNNDSGDEDEEDDSTSDITETNQLVLQLQRQISTLEKQVIELEKKLTQLDQKFADKFAGTMFLDVENHGRLWYVDPTSKNRFYFENGEAALSIGSKLATGITYEDIQKIPVGIPDKLYNLKDSDNDGLPDRLESALGSNPNNSDSDGDDFNDKQELENGYNPVIDQKYNYDQSLAERLEGKMLLQVLGPNSHGEIWYIKDGQRWYGGTEDSMYEIMKTRSLGATPDNIRKIAVGEVEGIE
ncbi:MAG: hypothetical protein U9Q85_03690, partial [Patescibacteria group bacterium]|nr:hypothetical protein [Patescibacteria group bacterium]